MLKKTKVLFVGSFKSQSDSGHVGGQMFACNTLINSRISDKVEWILIDTTASTNKSRSILSRSLGAARRMIKFIYHLLKDQPEIVLLFCSRGWSFKEKGTMAAIAKKMGKQVILAPRSGLIKDDVENDPGFRQFVINTLNQTDILLCQGPSWETYYKALSTNPVLKYKVIHNWIDLEKYINLPGKASIEKDLTVLFIGWITSNKGIWDILKAAEILKSNSIRFIMAGDGDEFKAFQKAIVEKDLSEKIKLLGWVKGEDKMKLLKSADLFILPSYREGYPNALVEAMASGLPVISTRVGSIPDLILDGENGFLIKPGDAATLAEKILFLETNREQLQLIGKQARKTVIEKNAINHAVQNFEEILV